MFFIYILRSEPTGRFYTGCTKDVSVRLAEHNVGKTPSTKAYRPWRLVYTESFATLTEARRREREIKSWKSRERMVMVLGLQE